MSRQRVPTPFPFYRELKTSPKVARDSKLSYTQAVKQSIFETCKNLDDSAKRAIEALLR